MPRNAGRVKIILVIESPSFYSFQFKKEPGTRCLCGFPALFVDNVDNFSFCSEKWALFSKNMSILVPPPFINSLNPLIFRGFPPFPRSFLVVPSFQILLTVILIEYKYLSAGLTVPTVPAVISDYFPKKLLRKVSVIAQNSSISNFLLPVRSL